MNISDADKRAGLLLLVARGLEHEAKERLREMTPDGWRALREACSRLDELIDDVVLEKHQQRRQPHEEA